MDWKASNSLYKSSPISLSGARDMIFYKIDIQDIKVVDL
jgi:hypothetical protein